MEKVIVFQGDSITDAGRSRTNDAYVGGGYPALVKGQLGHERPGEFVFYNRGVGGDRVPDLYARIKRDILILKPDYLSILIGVNDVWHEYDAAKDGVDTPKYEKIYRMLIEEIKEELPDCRIMILEPFVLPGLGTKDTEEIPDKWNNFRREVEDRAAAAKRVAEDFGLVFVPLQEEFDRVAKITGPAYWLRDGVHPSEMGHDLIKDAWLEGFKKLEK